MITNIVQGGTTVTVGNSFTITINYTADPEPTVTWQLNGGDLTMPTNIVTK